MIGAIIVSHNLFADGILTSCDMIFGNHHDCQSVCLTEGVDTFSKQLNDKLDQMFHNYSFVFAFADLKGGTPYNQLLRYQLEHQKDNMMIVPGVNLPMIIELLGRMDSDNPIKLIHELIEIGKDNISITELENDNDSADMDDDILS